MIGYNEIPEIPVGDAVESSHGCCYKLKKGSQCPFEVPEGHDFCFWHDPETDKSSMDARITLTQLCIQRVDCAGFELSGLDLSKLRLSDGRFTYANFSGSSLEYCDLKKGRFFRANFKGASLFRAELCDANMRSTDLQDANLLRTNLDGVKLEGANFGPGDMILQERKALKADRAGDYEKGQQLWLEAEETYLALHKCLESLGRADLAGRAYYRFMCAKRKLLPKGSFKRSLSWIMDCTCGYGERPMRVVGVYLAIILISSVFYLFLGIDGSTGVEVELSNGTKLQVEQPITVQFDNDLSVLENVKQYGHCLYFSVITITTTGYGDYVPSLHSRPVSVLESFLGAFLIAVLVMVFGLRMMRS